MILTAAILGVVIIALTIAIVFFRGRRGDQVDVLDHAALKRVVERHERERVGSDS